MKLITIMVIWHVLLQFGVYYLNDSNGEVLSWTVLILDLQYTYDC